MRLDQLGRHNRANLVSRRQLVPGGALLAVLAHQVIAATRVIDATIVHFDNY